MKAWLNTPLGRIIGGLAAIIILGLVTFHEYVWAWWYYDLSQTESRAYLEDDLETRGIVARLEKGGFAILRKSDVTDIGASKCEREISCARSGRRTCFEVDVNYTCVFEIKDRDGKAAFSVVEFRRDHGHRLGYNRPRAPKKFATDSPGFEDAEATLCKFGFGCAPTPAAATAAPTASEPAVTINPAVRDLKDCKDGFCAPPLLALPKGRFQRGSTPEELARLVADNPQAAADWYDNETPAHEVTIGYEVAIGKYEVTVTEWMACVADGACKQSLKDLVDAGLGQLPANEINFLDITNEYLPWLNGKLGLSGTNAYRLPTDAEWEYAARAGTTTRYSFGDSITAAEARFRDGTTIAVGSFKPNPFGLYDVHGNVWEIVQDCSSGKNYEDYPRDGSAFVEPKCSTRMMRGGATYNEPEKLRSAIRTLAFPDDRDRHVGFRLARTLSGP